MIAYMIWHARIIRFPYNYPWELYIAREIAYLHVAPIATFQRHPHNPSPNRYGWATYRIKLKRTP